MAQSAVGAIRAGCQMLSEGKQFIDDAKSEVEGIVGQVKETYETVTGLWGWVTRLFGGTKQTEDASPATPVAAAKVSKLVAKKVKPELSYEEFQARAVHKICENLKVYFEAIRQLKIHCRELDEEALTTEKVADSAIDRIEIQWQMKQLSAQLKQSMIYGTPESLGLGAMYAEFLAKQDEIVEEQEVARELKLKKDRDNAWQHDHREQILMAKLGYVVVLTVAALWITALYSAL
jgi:predicted ATP-dependent protease